MRLHPAIKTALEETRMPYELVNGGRHVKIRLAGRLVGILPYNGHQDPDRCLRNLVATIRRSAKEIRSTAHERQA